MSQIYLRKAICFLSEFQISPGALYFMWQQYLTRGMPVPLYLPEASWPVQAEGPFLLCHPPQRPHCTRQRALGGSTLMGSDLASD